MLRLLSMALLSLLATTLVRAEETIDSRADYVLDCVDRGKYLETEGVLPRGFHHICLLPAPVASLT